MTPSKLSLAALVSGAVLVSTSAVGQLAPGVSGSSTQVTFGEQETWDTVAAFGYCFAYREQADAIRLVSTRPESVDEVKEYRRIFKHQNQNCLGDATEMSIPPHIVRGAIAEGLYRRGVPVPPAIAATPLTVSQVRNFMDAAICYAAAHRGEVRELLGTRLGTKAEAAAVQKIGPKLGECIPAAARQLSLSAPLIRVRLAEAMWRLGERPQVRTGS